MTLRHALRPSVLLAAALIGLGAPATWAQTAAPWFARASLALLHDSNFLRLADTQAAPAGYTKADSVATGTLAAGFNQRFGTDQKVFVEAQVQSNRLAHNRLFDNQGWGARAGLDWRVGNIASGEVRLRTDRSLASLESGTTGVPSQANLITASSADAVFRVGRRTGFNGEAGVRWREVDNSVALFDSRDFHEGTAFLGVLYRPSELTTVGLAGRATRGSYPRYQALTGGGFRADDYEGRYVDLSVAYVLTGKSELYSRLSSGRIRHENAVQSDFSGLTGSLGWKWTPTAKLTFNTQLSREPSQDAFFVSEATGTRALEFSRISTSAVLAATFRVSERFEIRAKAGGIHRELSQTLPLAGGASVVISGSDRQVIGSLGATWQPTRMFSLGCDIGHDLRRGVAPLSSDITNSSLGCQIQLSLGGPGIDLR
ncbi:MAG: hypothetical protein ACKO6D_11620 [Rubrivivax sp.]